MQAKPGCKTPCKRVCGNAGGRRILRFLAFLKRVARAYPRVPLHVVCDNYATHKHPNVKAWLTRHLRVQLHFIPTSGS